MPLMSKSTQNREILILTSEIAEAYGGLTGSLLVKAKWFAKLKNWHSKILTMNWNANYASIIKKLYLDEKITELTEVVNLNEFFRDSSHRVGIETDSSYVDSWKELEPNRWQNASGDIIERKYSDMYGIMHDNLWIGGKIRRRTHFDRNGTIHKISTFDDTGHHVLREDYINQFGGIYQSRQYIVNENGKTTLIKVMLFSDDASVVFESDNITEFRRYFINQVVNDQPTFAMAETRAMDPVLLDLHNPMVKTIYMVHNPHIRPGTNIIRAGNRPVLNGRLNEIDAYLLLTDRQRQDVEKRFGYRDNYFTISHPIEEKKITQQKDHTIVMLTRLDYQKRLDHAVRIFELVHQKDPTLKLEIYGKGDKELMLKEMIAERHLEDVVFLRGHSQEAQNVVQRAMFSLITSRYEGFPLAVEESLANGTPVLAYDIKYGPADMVQDGYNGYLIKEGDIKTFANKIVLLANDATLLKKMSANAIESTRKWNPTEFVEKWQALFNHIELSESVTQYDDLQMQLKSVNLTKEDLTVDFTIKGNDQLDLQTADIYALTYDEHERQESPELYMRDKHNVSQIDLENYTFKVPIKQIVNKHIVELRIVVQYQKYYNEFPLIDENVAFQKQVSHQGVVRVGTYLQNTTKNLKINVRTESPDNLKEILHSWGKVGDV